MTARVRHAVAALALVLSGQAQAYDSLACGEGALDCEGLAAARTPWVKSEHARIWLRAREIAGLPGAVDAPFTVDTFLGGSRTDAVFSFDVVPLDAVRDMQRRELEVAVFAQLPDKAYALWDWTAGNEGCPPTQSADLDPRCHAFKAHMGWLNSNHFLPQAEQVFRRYHQLALERAAACQRMAAAFTAATSDGTALLQACDREALILEAIGHHFLQDAWSMGHMWQRWGSPELPDFQNALAADPSLGVVDAIGDAVGRGSGIIHGAQAITKLADAMCAPDDGVEFSYEGTLVRGAGDLYLDQVLSDPAFEAQFELLFRCGATAMREVYDASARSFGPAAERLLPSIELDRCFSQRATNRALGLGAAIQVPVGLAALMPPPLSAALGVSSAEYLTSLGLNPLERSDFYLPLTSELLTRINIGGILFAQSVVPRWHEDMRRVQGAIRFFAPQLPQDTQLANGLMGPLLGMQPNGGYVDRIASSTYLDVTLPWTPTATAIPLEPTVTNARNIVSRTFVDAHVDDWCAVMSVDGDDEFSLVRLRDRCVRLSEQDDNDADVACDVCARFAEWFVFDPEPDVAANPALALAPACSVLLGEGGIRATAAAGDFDRASLARTWCATVELFLEGLSVEPLQGCEGDPDATMIRVRVVDLDGEPVAGVRVTFTLDDVTVGSGTSNDDGVAEYLYDEDDNALRVVRADVNGANVTGEFFIINAGERCAACPGTVITQDDVDACGATECRQDDEACNAELGCACAFACTDIGFACGCALDATIGAVVCACCCGCA